MSDITYTVTTRGQLPPDVVERVSRAAAKLMAAQTNEAPTGREPAGDLGQEVRRCDVEHPTA